MNWRCMSMIFKAVLVSILLQTTLSYVFEDETPANNLRGESLFYHPLHGSIWNFLRKMRRGYMVPYPRIGREIFAEEKRQGMIPLPRVGRELVEEEELIYSLIPLIKNLLKDMQAKLGTPKFSGDSKAYNFLMEFLSENNFEVDALKDLTAPSEFRLNKDIEKPGLNQIFFENDVNSNLLLENHEKSNSEGGISSLSNPKDFEERLTKESNEPGFDIFEDGKHQGLVPVSRLGRGDYWTIVEEKKQGGGMMPYPRLGRKIFKLPQTLIPYPRAGRDTFQSVNDLYDLMYPDYVFAGPEDPWTDIQFDSFPLVEKRRNIKLIPRIGRKKRSVSDSENEHESNSKINGNDMRDSEATERIWDELDDIDRDYYKRSDRQSARSRNSFVPRVGKKNADDEFLFESKRKMLFTPRIGRASLIPRIGRNDPRFKVKSRGAFIPRIGRASAFVPRIGRSESHQLNSTPII